MKIITYFLFTFFFLSSLLSADTKELDAYWAEVSRAVKTGDFKAYKATCHPDGVLVSGSKKKSYPLADALKKWKKEFDDTKAGTRKSSASFRFKKRYQDDTTAYESGMLLYEFSTNEGKSGKEYVFLEALLLKRDGRWQIMMEYQIPGGTKGDWEKLKNVNAPKLGGGIKIGEVTQDAAIVWTRLTATDRADFGRLPILTKGLKKGMKDEGRMPLEVLPGTAGEVRVTYGVEGKNKLSTDWKAVDEKKDFTHQFKLLKLESGKHYKIEVEARSIGKEITSAKMEGSFHTAPAITDATKPVRFIVSTCQAVRSIDSGVKGHVAYKNMLNFKPHFFVHTGDILYYDKAPLCKTVPEARSKWNLMFAYQHNLNFHRQVSSYFIKDDHDTLKNDCWPGQTYGDLTFAQGLDIFREQVPMGKKTYRTIRWGKDVQIWLTEHRDFRSANNAPDGPEKTILGAEQKAWLMQTMRNSDAKHKFLIVPGPIVGPDKKGKSDNHSNKVFLNEGQQLRNFLAKQENTYVITGDRHWQYCSVDPKTKVFEMGCGPINDEHMFGGNSGRKPEFHRYFSGKGGFLGVTVKDGKAKAEWYSAELDQHSRALKVLHSEDLPVNVAKP